MRVITMLSGGQDSTTALFWAKREQPGARHFAMSFDYGQRHRVELQRAREIAGLAGIAASDHIVVPAALDVLGDNALVSSRAITLDGRGGLPSTFVPGRNLVFLSYAAAWAGTLGASAIVFGASAVDFSGYPDCRPVFVRAAQQAAQLALGGDMTGLQIATPLMQLSKAATVRLALELGDACWRAVARSWSCYDPMSARLINGQHQTGTFPCTRCPACALRARGFADVGVADPAVPA